MVKFFQAYSLRSSDAMSKIEDKVSDCQGIELEDLMADFNPNSDRTDAIMLYLLTGSHQHDVMKDWVDKPR